MFNIIVNSFFQLNQIKQSSISIVFIFLLLITSACGFSFITQQGSGGSDPSDDLVDVFIEPNGTKPLVFLGEGGTQICRRGFPDESIYGLAPDEIREQEEQTEGEENNQSSTQTVQNTSQSITRDVGENWFRMGLLIVNKSKTYYLVISDLQFHISAPWGNELLFSNPSISSGYCGSHPLYMIPPTRKDARPNSYSGDRYIPLKKNYINNLTLFVEGVPIPEAPPVQTREDTAGGSDTRNNAQTQSTIPRAPEPFVITYLPTYKVKLVLLGHWIDKNRQPVANFDKTINFSLSSQFLN